MIDIFEEVKDAKTVGISGHVRPDGDCVGSCMGLALYLRKVFPQLRVDVFLEDFSPALEKHIAGSETIHHEVDTDVKHYDVFFCLDCEKTRLGDAMALFDRAAKTINIDHHRSNPGCADLNYVVPTASSACELVYGLLDRNLIDEGIARNLYIGMMTDTGVFQYSNTGKSTMEIAGDLMSFGFDYSAIVREVFYEKTYIQQQILGRALLESILFMDGKCIFSRIDRKTMQFYQAKSKDMDGVVSQLVQTEGVLCSVFMYEIQPLTYKVSLRSNTDDIDVSKVAEQFGGGGHIRAAGCTVNAPWHDIINNMAAAIEQQMSAHGLTEEST